MRKGIPTVARKMACYAIWHTSMVRNGKNSRKGDIDVGDTCLISPCSFDMTLLLSLRTSLYYYIAILEMTTICIFQK